jgi:recombination protein RecA
MYNVGIAKEGDVLDTSVAYGIVEKRGNSYGYAAEKLGVGRQNAIAYLRDKPALVQEMRDKVLAKALAAAEAPTNTRADEAGEDEVPPAE